jgi:hypothetical protein
MRVLLVGDDWAEDHHDVELMDAAGRTLAVDPSNFEGSADHEQIYDRCGIATGPA